MKNVLMNRSKHLAYILKSNWIHLLGIYLCIEVMMISYGVKELIATHEWKPLIAQIFLSALFLMFTWGLMFLLAFYSILLILDVILFATVKKGALFIVMLEWFIIVPIFIYWAITNEYWLWIALVIVFFITQITRSRRIDRKLKIFS